jgi:hypothetical protein
MPKHLSSLLNSNAVPLMSILHGTHEISLRTVQAILGRIEGFWKAWTPIYFRPGTLYQAMEDHAMHKPLLEPSSTLQVDPMTHIQFDYKGNRGTRQATLGKFKGQSRTWKLDEVINFVIQLGRANEHVKFLDYLRQRTI